MVSVNERSRWGLGAYALRKDEVHVQLTDGKWDDEVIDTTSPSYREVQHAQRCTSPVTIL